MLLEKPQNEAVEQILTDCYEAGQESILNALRDYMAVINKSHEILHFFTWYEMHEDKYKMKFKVEDK